MFLVLTSFFDLQDKNYEYHEGDIFPRKGIKVSDQRIQELASDKNRRKKPLIQKVEEKPKKKKANLEEITE